MKLVKSKAMHSWVAAMFLVFLFATHAMGAQVSGLVTDQAGDPIAAARVDHIGARVINAPAVPSSEQSGAQTTDAAGRFQITTEAPAIVVRKPGYESVRLLIKGDEAFKIVLQPIKPVVCKVNPPPKWQKKQANDVDYSGSLFVVKTTEGKKGILSGSGPMYSLGAPNDRDVWTSVYYYEVMYPNGIIDARGHTSNGKYWRSKTVIGAAAQYYDVDAAVAQQLDCVMDAIDLPKS